MKASEKLYHLKKEAESRHKMGLIVPSWLYEEIHRLEKMVKQEKQKTAEQMFKELGYEKLEPAFPDWIEYGRVENYPLVSYFRFDTTYCQFNCALEMMNWSDIKAVITQMKELGWIDEILGETE